MKLNVLSKTIVMSLLIAFGNANAEVKVVTCYEGVAHVNNITKVVTFPKDEGFTIGLDSETHNLITSDNNWGAYDVDAFYGYKLPDTLVIIKKDDFNSIFDGSNTITVTTQPKGDENGYVDFLCNVKEYY